MINFKEVFESVEFEIPTVPDFEFCDTKDIYFKTPEDDYLALIKLNKVNSLLFITNGYGDEVERREFDITLEIKNGVVHGRVIHWPEWIDYAEYEQGVMHGYSEYAFQNILDERGFYKNGKKDGWWESGDPYISYDDNGEGFHTLDNYRPGSYAQYIDGVQLNSYMSLDSEFEYKLMAEGEYGPFTRIYKEFKRHPETFDWIKQQLINLVKEKVEKGEVYRGDNSSYFSYETYLSLTNLPKLKTPRSQTKEFYDHCARSIDYNAIYNQYQKILKNKNLKKENFTNDMVKIINDQET